ncbi:alpha/beta fold hydrolase [Carboxylicivirga sp. RSCT41]|uniref:alpha/beta fold hydrolase n=1 Tax=Carboxylicivirga agarovorans TaxID=3417570 RepID=UPI003D341023
MRTLKQLTLSLILFIATVSLSAGEFNIKVEKMGQGRPVVFLPGFTCPGDVWHEIAKPLTDNYECHLVSYPGFNGIAAPDTLWYQTVINSLKEYITNELHEKPIVIGHSVGGLFAMQLAIDDSKVYERLILVDALTCMASVMMPGVALENITYDSPYNQNMMAMDDEQFAGMANNMAGYMTLKQDKKSIIADWIKQADRQTYVYGYTEILKLDLRKQVEAIKVPVLVLAAVPFNLEQTKQIMADQYALIGDKRIEYIENSGHFIMFDQPEWLSLQITSFIN